MFRAMFSPIIRSTWLYLQLLVVFTQVVAGWCHGWVEIAVPTHPRHQYFKKTLVLQELFLAAVVVVVVVVAVVVVAVLVLVLVVVVVAVLVLVLVLVVVVCVKHVAQISGTVPL